MSRTTFAALALALSAALAQAQAVAPVAPPARPPAVRSVVNAPAFPTPGATPAGAGLYAPGADGSSTPVPRSPNKRVLPASNEPGLWAADGAPQASGPRAPIFGVELPYPDNAGDGEKELVRNCANTMSEATVVTGANAASIAYPAYLRQCLAAMLYAECALGMRDFYEHLKKQGTFHHPGVNAALANVVKHAMSLVDEHCSDVVLTPEQKQMRHGVVDYWKRKSIESAEDKL